MDISATSASVSLQFRNNWWLSSMLFQNLSSAGAFSIFRNSGFTALKGTVMTHNKVNSQMSMTVVWELCNILSMSTI